MQISVLLTIFNRRLLLEKTLLGYKNWGPYTDTELVIVDDSSSDKVEELMPLAKDVFGKVKLVTMDKTKSIIPVYWNCPGLGLNIGVRHCSYPVILKTDPECYPLNDNIRWLQKNYQPKTVVFGRCSFGRYEFNEWFTLDKVKDVQSEHALLYRFPNAIERIVVSAAGVRGPWWFVCAFEKKQHEYIRGIDEEFLKGFAGDDDDWGERMQRGGAQLVWNDELTVLHQWHRAPIDKVKEDKTKTGYDGHQHNINLLIKGRAEGKVFANLNHEWGASQAVVSVKEY